MGKKLIYLLLAVFLGGFIVLQSCNESPIVSNEPFNSSNENGKNLTVYPNNGMTVLRTFYGTSEGFPVLCENPPKRLPIYAGQDYLAGYLEFTQFTPGTKPMGRIIMENVGYPTLLDPPGDFYPWVAVKIDLHIAPNLDGIPQNPQGQPKIGSFAYHDLNPVKSNIIPFEYPYTLTGDEFYVALHMEVCSYGGAEGFDYYLPDGVITYNVTKNKPYSWYKVEIVEGGEFLNGGIYESFCVDADLNIDPPTTLTGHIVPSTGILPPECLETAIENWSNMDLVNWIVNEYPVGSSVPQYTYSIPPTIEEGYPFYGDFDPVMINGIQQYGTVTWQDLQAAIWALLEGGEPLSIAFAILSETGLTLNNVWGIVNDAITNPDAEGFVPECEDIITAVLCPDGGNVQIITIQPVISFLQMPCITKCETAWGDGKEGINFVPNKSWATYFKWNRFECTQPQMK